MARALAPTPQLDAPVDDEYPIPEPITERDVRWAVRILAVHRPQQWPAGLVCANDRAAYPCQLRRWADSVLRDSGLDGAQLAELAALGPGRR
jgi:hypothetical protein